MLFTDLNLEVNKETSIITFNDKEIEIKNYLPTKDKYDLIMITLQKAMENGVYNDFKLDTYFHLNLIYLMTNLEFTDADREDEDELYDKILSSGLLSAILGAVNPELYEYLLNTIDSVAAKLERNNQSLSGLLENFMQAMPQIDNNWAELLQSFDLEQLQDLSSVIQELGGANYNKN